MADNLAILRWLATQAGITNLVITAPVDNPTSSSVLLFSFTVAKSTYLHRIFIANDSSINQTYILQHKPTGAPAFIELGRITLEPGITWRNNYELALAVGESIRLAIDDDPDATGVSLAVCEYLEAAAK